MHDFFQNSGEGTKSNKKVCKVKEPNTLSILYGSPPLEGVRILDLTWYLPYTTILADFGAEVIKVGPPKRSDPVRRQPR